MATIAETRDTPPKNQTLSTAAGAARKQSIITLSTSSSGEQKHGPPPSSLKPIQQGRRRSSVGFSSLGHVALLGKHRMSKHITERPHQQTQYENTYRMAPQEDQRFKESEVRQAAGEVLEIHLRDVEYDHRQTPQVAMEVSEIIRRRVKEMDMPRYKLICYVVLAENMGQGVEVGSRCVWDLGTDRFATATFKNKTLYAVAFIHGVYME